MNFFNNFVLWAKLFRIFGKKFMQDCQNCFLHVQISVLRNLSEKVSLLFNIFGKWAKNYPNIGRNFPAGFSKLHLKSPEKHLEDFFEKSATFSSFLDFIQKILSNFCRKSSASLSEMHYTCQGEHFEKEQLFGKKYMFFLIAIGLPANFFSEIRQKLFTTGVQTVFCAYRGEVGAESFFGKKHFFIVVRNFSNEKLGVLAKTRLQGCQNCVLCVQGNALRFVLKKIHFFSSLSEYEQKAIKLLAAISRQACLNCNLDVGGIISRKKKQIF